MTHPPDQSSDIKLPDVEWRSHDGLRRIIRALSDGEKRPLAVGGAVRDSLIGLEVSDVDLATHLLPDEVIRRLETAGVKTIPTGIDHGTVTAVADRKNFEITSFRRDVATDGRRAVVAFSDDWREDAQRRDFTINALYADVESGEIFDAAGGLEDLQERRIRFIGQAENRIAEDHLRILRYFRFLARFGGQQVDEQALAACRDAASSLKSLSRERIASELTRMVVLPDPSLSIKLMIENGIFAAFLPEVTEDAQARFAELLKREAALETAPTLEARLLSLLPADGDILEKLGRRLKFSNALRKGLVTRSKETSPDAENIRSIAYRCGLDTARDAAMIYTSDGGIAAACLNALKGWEVPLLPISGKDLIALGIEAGPDVSKTLEAVRKQWMTEGFPDAARVQQIARELTA